MNELHGRLLVEGRLWPGRVVWDGERISAIELDAQQGSAEAPIVTPGLVDLHVHGFGGCGPVDDLPGMARALARAGTTSFQPTLFPGEPRRLGLVAEATWSRAEAWNAECAGRGGRVVGLHLEGPFVNPRSAGALPPEDLAEPSPDGLRALLGPSSGSGRGVRTMTLAPELSGGAQLVEELARCGVRASLGHSLATAAEARDAARRGGVGATHLFNAMRPLHHREVGLAGFALTDEALFAELIGDLVHVGADAVTLALVARGPDDLCLVSDALSGAGTGCERFHSHGRDHLVRDGAAYYPPARPGEEPRLAGSALSQLEMVRRLVGRGVVGIVDALTMASRTPARALGLEGELGALVPGARADMIVLEGPHLELRSVFVAGRELV